MKKQYFHTTGHTGQKLQTLAISKAVAEKILEQADRRFADMFGHHPRIKPVKKGRVIPIPFFTSVVTIHAPEVWQGGYLAGWLIGYRHIGAVGILPTKPPEGFSVVIMDNALQGAISDRDVDNWAQLPETLRP